MPSLQPWPVLRSVIETETSIFRLRRDHSRSPRTGKGHDFYILESQDWINVVPVTPDGDLVMVRQYRHGIRQLTLEIPGGIVDHAGEPPLEAARRELREETGYLAQTLVPIGTVQAQPALQDNLCHTFLALGVTPVGDPDPDPGEDLQVVRVPLQEVPARVAAGEIAHGLVLAALYWLELWRREHPDRLPPHTSP